MTYELVKKRRSPLPEQDAPPEQDPTPSKRGWVEGPASREAVAGLASGEAAPDDDPTGPILLTAPKGIGFESTDAFVDGTAGFQLQSGEEGDEIPSIPPGTILAQKYRVIRMLGRGGMGIVVEARHTTLETRVAIKVLRQEFVAHPQASGRFLREARAASKLTGDHVAGVLDVGTLESGEPFMVMEFLAGGDLAYHTRAEGPLPIRDAIDYITQSCVAIAAAHDLGIVHRDIKPANLFLTRTSDGVPLIKVLDFGVSKVIGEGEGDLSLTQTTSILGSALYMSPEQMNSARSVDHRTDIYALGATLYELIGGEPPHVAKTFPELCVKVLTQPPRPLQNLRPDVPEGLVKIIERALERDPAKRYGSVAEFIQALSPYARGRTRLKMAALFRQHAPELRLLPPQRPDKRWSPLFLAVLCVSALVMGSGVAWIALGGHKTLSAWLGRGTNAESPPSAPTGIEPPAAPPGPAAIAPAAVLDPSSQPDAGAEQADAAAEEAADAASPPDAATADATTDAPADAADEKASEKAAATKSNTSARPKEKHFEFEVDPGSALNPHSPGGSDTTTPAPPVNSDLSQETCYAQYPDGTRRQVPCP